MLTLDNLNLILKEKEITKFHLNFYHHPLQRLRIACQLRVQVMLVLGHQD